ncbi:MAG: GAF domain-containing protein [Chloroflexaceae bacterium]|nr:GAF domain-containing protein [Chloroflexaceae bacterium]
MMNTPATVSTPAAKDTRANSPLRQRVSAGERLSTTARWMLLVLLLALLGVIHETLPWAIPLDTPTMLVLLVYAGFTLAMTIVLVLPPIAARITPIAPALDLLFLGLLTLLSGPHRLIFFPAYLVPLMNLAVRQRSLWSLFAGIVGAALFAGAVSGGHRFIDKSDTLPDGPILGAMSLALALLPWFVSSLAEHWSDWNRQRVEEARQAAQQQSNQARQAAQTAQEQVSLLYTVATRLATMADSTAGQKKVLNALLEESQKLIPYTHAIILRKPTDPDEAGHPVDHHDDLRIEAGQSLNPRDLGSTITIHHEGKLATLLHAETRPVLIPDLAQDADLSSIATLHPCKAAWVAPLHYGVLVYGAMILASDQPQTFHPGQMEWLDALAKLGSVALRNGELLAELRPHREKLLKSEARAREELTRHVHDGLAQTLAQIVMNVDFLKRMVVQDAQGAQKELDTLHEQFRRYHFEVREVLTALSPLPLGQGLYVILNQFLERKRTHDKDTRIIVDAESIKGLSLNYKVENMLYNILQESVNNALKYSEARQIWVQCKVNGDRLMMTIADNGKGFDVEKGKEKARSRGSFGLFNISERARLAGGSADVRSVIGKGTMVRVVAPITSSDE